MKTRIEIANAKIEKIKQESYIIANEKYEIKASKLAEFKTTISKYFSDCLEEGDELDVSERGTTFLRPQEEYSYKKDILNVYHDSNHGKTEEIEKLKTSFYSTSDSSEFELRRMVLIGKVGQVILDFSDDIIAELNQITSKYKEELSKLNTSIWDLEKQITRIKNDIDKFEKENLLEKLEKEGIEFELKEGETSSKLPDMYIKTNYTVSRVKGIKILKKTSSGKSADIELKTMYRNWDQTTETYKDVDNTILVGKVRMDKIQGFVQYYSNRISVS
jgi:hypothetical protein